MSDFDDQMAEWRKTVWGTGPCPDSSQNNFTLTDAEREALIHAMAALDHVGTDWTLQCAATLRGLLERLA